MARNSPIASVTHVIVAVVSLTTGETRSVADVDTQVRENRCELAPSSDIVLKVDPRFFPARVAAPAAVFRKEALFVPFRVNYNPASCSGTLAAWPAASRAAFDRAVAIWSTLLDGTQLTEIDACWRTDLGPTVLGSASATRVIQNFAGAPAPNTWYSVALANELSGADQNGAAAEIRANFNATFAWYFGVDGQPPAGQYDFVTVVAHEICHGLGFFDSMNVDDGLGAAECGGVSGQGCWNMPSAYDRFIENGFGQNLVAMFPNPSIALGNQLTSSNLFFDGPNANAGNGGNHPRLFAPTVFDLGSSIAHLDDTTFDGTSHALMTHALANGESAHHPGRVTLGILRDTGWPMPDSVADVYVDGSVVGPGEGSPADPFGTVLMGVLAVFDGGSVHIVSGVYGEELILHRPMILRREGPTGTVVIGQ